MKYLILEIQTAADGTVATLITQKDDLNQAQSTYYSILSAAAISQIPLHAAALMTNEGIVLMFQSFDRREEETT